MKVKVCHWCKVDIGRNRAMVRRDFWRDVTKGKVNSGQTREVSFVHKWKRPDLSWFGKNDNRRTARFRRKCPGVRVDFRQSRAIAKVDFEHDGKKIRVDLGERRFTLISDRKGPTCKGTWRREANGTT